MDMIGGIHKHGRNHRDTRNLFRHLMKDAACVEIVNSVAVDLGEFLGDLETMRDATKAEAAFLHAYLSPSSNMSPEQLRKAAETVVEHFGASEHPYAIVYHNKPRNGGSGESHVHIVIGRVSPELRVLEAKFEKIRLETAVRICEYELGEQPVLGRHHKSGLKWLQEHRPEVAEWLQGAFGAEPTKPISAVSPPKRQSLERRGLNLSGIREAVLAAWFSSTDASDLHQRLSRSGLSVCPGDKAGVYVVMHGDTEIGALDRIAKLKRRDVAAKMKILEVKNESASPKLASHGSTCEGDLRQGATRRAGVAASVGRVGERVLESRRERSAQGDAGSPRSASEFVSVTAPVVGRPSRQGGRSAIQAAVTVAVLSKLEISPAAREMMEDLNRRADASRKIRPEFWQMRLRDGVRRTVDQAWQRLRDCIEILGMCSDSTFEILTARNMKKFNDRDFADSHPRDVETHEFRTGFRL